MAIYLFRVVEFTLALSCCDDSSASVISLVQSTVDALVPRLRSWLFDGPGSLMADSKRYAGNSRAVTGTLAATLALIYQCRDSVEIERDLEAMNLLYTTLSSGAIPYSVSEPSDFESKGIVAKDGDQPDVQSVWSLWHAIARASFFGAWDVVRGRFKAKAQEMKAGEEKCVVISVAAKEVAPVIISSSSSSSTAAAAAKVPIPCDNYDASIERLVDDDDVKDASVLLSQVMCVLFVCVHVFVLDFLARDGH